MVSIIGILAAGDPMDHVLPHELFQIGPLSFTNHMLMLLVVAALMLIVRPLTTPVPGELIVKPLREADRALDSESANGSHSMWSAIWECPQQIQPAYRRRVSYGRDDGCNTFGNLQAFSPSQPRSRIMYG